MSLRRWGAVAERWAWADRMIGLRGRTVLGMGLAALLLVAGVAYAVLREEDDIAARMQLSWRTRTAIHRVQNLCVEAETGVRGYLLTGRDAWLEPYEAARRALPAPISELRDLVREEGAPVEGVNRVESMAAERLELLGQLRAAGGSARRASPELLERSKASMDALKAQLAAMEEDETRRLVGQRESQRRTSRGLILVLAASVGLGLVAKVLAAMLWNSSKRANEALLVEITERTRSDTALIQAARDLEGRVEARTQELQQANQDLTLSVAELERRNLAAAQLSQMVDLLQSCLTVEEAARVASHWLPRFFPDTSGFLALLNPSRNLLESVAHWGDPAPGERVFGPDDCWALRRGQIHRAEPDDPTVSCGHVGGVPGAYACLPLQAQGELLGVLHLRDGQLDLGDAHSRGLLQSAGENIALAVANLRLRESLRNQSIRDPLTGLYNRRYMEESLDREIRRAARSQRPLGILMMDVDHFKTYNDSFGHAAGDALLRELGAFVRAFVRAEDIACRYGGEEFVLILPEVSSEGARQRAERLREGVKQLHTQPTLEGFPGVTISIGVAAFPAHGSAPEAVLRVADAALYRAKSEGRDQVVVAPAPARLEAVRRRSTATEAAISRGRRRTAGHS